MNGMATDGKNLQTGFAVEKGKGAYETGPASPSSPHGNITPLISSLTKHQRTPVSVLSVAQPQPRTARNYGGRKLRYRLLEDLKPWQVHQLHEADAVASQLGFQLNIFVTINWHGTFPGGAAMASTFKRGMKRMGQWFRDNGSRAAFVYVHENPDDEKPNSHLLVHVPKHLRRRFETIAGTWFDALDGGVDVQLRNDAQRRAQGKTTRLQYMAKGAPYVVCRYYKGYRAKGGQGPIAIKRAGVAQCLRGKPEFRLASTRETRPELSDAIKGGGEFFLASTREVAAEFQEQYTRVETRFLAVDNGSRGAA